MRRWRAPLEVKLVTGLLIGVALLYLLVGILIMTVGGGSDRTIVLPVTSLVFGALAAAGIGLRMAFARYAAYAVVVLFALIHAFVLLSGQTLWIKVFSGLAAAGYLYAGVLLSSAPMLRYLTGSRE